MDSSTRESSSSAIDLTGTPAGFGSSRPGSPSLVPSESRGSYTRRRTSRGFVDVGEDPLRVDVPMEAPRAPKTNWMLDDDPFASPTEEDYVNDLPYRPPRSRYQDTTGAFPTAQVGPSSVSLISEFRGSVDGQREDDEARLTSNMSRAGMASGWSSSGGSDPELSGAGSSARRRKVRYSTSPSPFKKSGYTLKAMSLSLRRASIRVVNFAGFGLEDHVRLAEVSDDSEDTLTGKAEAGEDDVDEEDAALPDLSKSLPIRGRTLGCLGPTSRIRMAMYRLLVWPWTEPIILLLIIFNAVVLTIQAHRSLALAADGSQNPPQIKGYFHAWEDYTLFSLFCFFTLEAFARIAVSGFLLDPEIPTSSLLSSFSFSAHRLQYLLTNLARPFTLRHSTMSLPREPPPISSSSHTQRSPSHARSDTVQSRTPMMDKAFSKLQDMHSHIRNPSEPTIFSTALRSDNPDVLALPFRLSIAHARVQTQRNVPYLRHSWSRIDFVAIVGFWVSFVLATAGVERGTYHIGIFRALSVLRTARLLAITSGTTTIMRSLKTARPLLASVAYFVFYAMILFSIIGIQAFKGSYLRSCNVLPTLGESLTDTGQNCGGYINSTTLQVMGYLKQDGTIAPVIDDNDEGWTLVDGRRAARRTRIKQVYESIRWCWVALALTSLVLQATRTVEMGDAHATILDLGELVLTVAFDIEIVVRIVAELPDWRAFFVRGQNLLDLVLAIGSTVIQIPDIHNSDVYPWLTAFQLTRFYRVILEIPRMKPLLLAVFGNMYGLANMTLFLIILNFVAALVGVQLLRGDIARGQFIDYGQIYNSFLAAYQLFSSENWTNVLYGVGPPEIPLRQAPVVILYLTGWFSLANFIVLQMFIAVINENFEIAEESKRSQQASHYWASHQPHETQIPWLRRLNPYSWLKAQPKAIAVEQLPSSLVLPMQKTLVEDFGLPKGGALNSDTSGKADPPRLGSARSYIRRLQQLFSGASDVDQMPMAPIRKRDSSIPQDPIDEETERYLEVIAALNSDTAAAEDVSDVLYERRAQQADFIRDHPTYDKTFWIFSQKNLLRRLCQKVVAPAGGERIFGSRHSPIAHTLFQLVLLLTVVGGIVVESIATPVYRRNYYLEHGLIRGTWFDNAEAIFGLVLFLEFIIKIIADGLVFTPNAYIRSIWNILDFLIMAGVVVNLTTGLIFIGGISRLTRSLKALRALRLITLIDIMRSTFESLIISGVTRILDACLLAILYMIPYAVWGLNIFNGLMKECNDTSVNDVGQCVDEYSNTIYGNSFGFLVPRVWADPHPSTTFSFDSFRTSLLILFEIVSLEGWIDVTTVAVSLLGPGQQPQMNASQFNSIFFLIYNLMGAVIILTLFVSIIIGNFTSKTGSALLTQPQREWIDLQKLIKRQRPSKRPPRPDWSIRAWCYDRAVHKHGWWHRMMTIIFTLHVIALMTQTLGTTSVADHVRDDLFLIVTVIYSIDTIMRLFGLGWQSFSANGWNLFDVIVAGGSLFTTFILQFRSTGFVEETLQKLFIISIAFKLVQRTNSLNKFFKTAVYVALSAHDAED
ncbi:hypothetical protein IEO21_06809 [Rhodonia placenta]|uniref:Ion transport domain-containing protein n=1 Tax=Rhodonia placenta TaxID=104341 RepID=A0A8H7U0Y8_9APHY|nr:hypothetical protein IEO21_06809 [Postia placenta]